MPHHTTAAARATPTASAARVRPGLASAMALAAWSSIPALPAHAADPAPAVTPATVLAALPPAAWAAVASDRLMVMDLAGGGRVVVALAPDFAPVHVANIVRLARAGFYDGLWIERVQDNYVTQWGDPTERKPLSAGIVPQPPAEYERAAAGLAFTALPYRDTYAPEVGYSAGFPVARDGGTAWLAHCYGMVGVGRDVNPSTGSGAELYTVIGQAPRALDRNIALVGRIVMGMPAMTALPRGTAPMGFYATERERLPIARVRMADQLPAAERPRIELLDTAGTGFTAWLKARANRRDDFFVRPAGAVDLCGALPPVRIDGRLPGAVGK